jgi:hypothetical protein
MRAPGMPEAQISALKPFGSFSRLMGISLSGVSVSFGACGFSGEAAYFAPLPMSPGATFGLSCAQAPADKATAMVTHAAIVFFILGLLQRREMIEG